MSNKPLTTHGREYMTVFLKRRSVIALCCGLLTMALSFYGIIAGVMKTINSLGKNGFFSFIYYTMISNTLAAVSVTFIVPFAVEGIRKKRFTLPRWAAVGHYIATVSIAIMMVLVLSIISWVSPNSAFGGSNTLLHVICPVLILVSFFQIETGYSYTLRDRILGVIPFFIYEIIYFIEVVLIGEANGGWPDIYRATEYIPPVLTASGLLAAAFLISSLIALASGRLTKRRKKKMFSHWKEIEDPIELKIEAYGLGIMTGKSGEKSGVHLPLDILEELSARSGMPLSEMIRPFMKGLEIGLNEREPQ